MNTIAAALLIGGMLLSQAPAKPDAKKNEEARQRREQAVFLLTGLADEAAKFDDATLRARVQARAADLLWSLDRARARSLFLKSWEAAVVSYAEAKRRQEEDVRRQKEEGGAAVVFGFNDVREEVLRLVASRDRALSEKFFDELADSRERETEEAEREARSGTAPLLEPPDAIAKRLRLAMDILRRDDVETALQFAEPALASVTMPGLEFVTFLRAKDAQRADAIYARMLAAAAASPASDANTVSLLSAYAFTPHVYTVIDSKGGRSSMANRSDDSEPEPSAESRSAFLRAAAQILLRPMTPEQLDGTTAGRLGTWSLINRLIPHYEQYAADLVEQMRARQTAIGLDDQARAQEEAEPAEGAPGEQRSRVDAMLERARRQQNPEDRDAGFAFAAVAASAEGDPRTDEIVESISSLDLRHQVRVYVDFNLARNALTKREHDRAQRLAEKGTMTNVQRAWVFVSLAKAAVKDDKERAASLLGKALEAARRIDLVDPDRPRALFAVAGAYADVEPKLVAERAAEAIEAANKAEGFTGEDGQIRLSLKTRGGAWLSSASAPEFDIEPVFALLARASLEDATLMAKNFEADAPRAVAVLAVAKTILATKAPTARR